MALNAVKCNSCNIVICEVLAFVQNKIDVMDEESLVRICITSFTVDEVSNAKKLLFDSAAGSSRRKVNRRGNGKIERELYDIIAKLKETDPDAVPIFVARELHKLPPVTFDHVDATRLLKDILLMKKDINDIKDNYVTKVELTEVKEQITFEKVTHMPSITNKNNSHLYQNTENTVDKSIYLSPSRHSKNYNDSSLDHFKDLCTAGHIDAGTTISTSLAGTIAKVREMTNVSKDCDEDTHVTQRSSTPVPVSQLVTYAQALQKEANKEMEWTLIEKKKKQKERFMGLRGCAKFDSVGNFKAANIKVPLFINNVDKDTSEIDIATYIMKRTQIHVDIEKINMKRKKQYDAYKIYVPRQSLSTFLDDKLWPEGIVFRRYIEFKKYASNNHINVHNGSQK